jgi:acetoin utilization protein AcuB
VTAPDTPVEEAAMIMLDQNIGCLPVVEGGCLCGIISDRDIFHAMVDITGVRHGGHRICVTIEDRPGTIRDVADIIRRHGFHLQGILTSYEGAREGSRKVVIRTTDMGDFKGLKQDLIDNYRNVQIRKG